MTDIVEVDQFDSAVYLIATTDDVIGGDTGISNKQGKALANRTRYLMNKLQQGGLHLSDTGSADAYSAALPITLAALVDGMELKVRAAHSNTGASTFTPNTVDIAAKPIWGMDHAALIGGEIVAGGELALVWNSSLNSPNGAWVLKSASGGTQKAITPAVGNAGREVATMAALFAAGDGLAAVSVADAGPFTLTKEQYGSAILSLSDTPSGATNVLFPAQTGFWVVVNNQGGSNNLTAKTTADGSTGVVIPQGGKAVVLYSDGTNMDFAGSANQSSMRVISMTALVGTGPFAVSGGYTVGNILVEKNGSLLEPADYTASDGANISFGVAAITTDKFTVYAFSSFTVAGAVSKAGDTMSGALTLSGDAVNALHAVPKQQLDANLALVLLTGEVKQYAGYAVPSGWLEANGDAVSRSTYAALFAALCPSSTPTISIASPAVVTDAAHVRRVGDRIRLTTTGALPTGLTATSTDYYVSPVNLASGTYSLHAAAPVSMRATPLNGTPGTMYRLDDVGNELAHGASAGDVVVFWPQDGGALPTGLTAGTPYYVLAAGLASTNFRVAATAGGTAINFSGSPSGLTTMIMYGALVNTTGSQSGTHTARGYYYGAGDGTTTFNVPDLRGQFVRGWDHGRNADPARPLGSDQASMVGAHAHNAGASGTIGGGVSHTVRSYSTPSDGGGSDMTSVYGGRETRPRNVALMMIIKT